MHSTKFNEVLNNIPRHVPIFKTIRPPKWCTFYGIKKDEEFYYDTCYGSWVRLKNRGRYSMPISSMQFIEYRLKNELPK